MRRLFFVIFVVFLITILFPETSYSVDSKRVTLTAGSPLTTTYSTSSPSLIVSEPGIFSNNKNLALLTTVNNVTCTVGESHTTAPDVVTSGNQHEIDLIASERFVLEDVGSIRNIYCRSRAGASLTAGDIILTLW